MVDYRWSEVHRQIKNGPPGESAGRFYLNGGQCSETGFEADPRPFINISGADFFKAGADQLITE